jgi:NADH-quinone oxidoreductase subunit C
MSEENKDNNDGATNPPVDPEREAKIKAAQEARVARLAAKQTTADHVDSGDSEVTPPKTPSPNQPKLDAIIELLKQHVGDNVVESSYINEQDRHLPYLIINGEQWYQAAHTLFSEPTLSFDYLRNLSGVDQETHLEVVYHLLSLQHRHEVCVKVKTNRDDASIPSVTPIWATANWNEREVYDLLGINFTGHPDLRRIMMPDDWEGYPLRKDYQPLDPEV